ncbi:PQQ-like beta-propeller repeat protein [Haladaptatus sp. T7]|uniref:PQQ-like beta-propeller repeat protein n=1 Tax=Haladaptatus sp. T7 TaxID=2029368 RepID=UPI0021A25655|nr:PQQ-like beta-propeller repeat protein [Haladaptatus sp. T7]GKZ15763.1 hypothetical protein HAL_36440 [Haladaptatus sp. T7]
MRTRTVAVVAVLLFSLVGAGAYAVMQPNQRGQLTEKWVSDTSRNTVGNHHVPAVAEIDGSKRIVVSVNVEQNDGTCSLVEMDANGTKGWQEEMPTENCNIHGYGDPIFADYDGDGTQDVLVATTEDKVLGFTSAGKQEFAGNLSWWGYTKPIVTDFTTDPGKEIVVTDLNGTVFVYSADGSLVWRKHIENSATVVAAPAVADFDGDGAPELAVGEKKVTVFERDGSVKWQTGTAGSVNWMTTAQTDGDPAVEIVAGTFDGHVTVIDGKTGDKQWSKSFGRMAAVKAVGDGDGDGQVEVYASTLQEEGDTDIGKLRALDASDGSVEWTTTLSTEDVQTMPPSMLGDLNGDGNKELVAVTETGSVSVINPDNGAVLASYERNVPIWTHVKLADIDGDGNQEILAVYGDGRVVAMDYSEK